MPTSTPPPVRPGARDATPTIHRQLRNAILMGEVAAGSFLSQASIAKELGVSRGPVREAFRLLQREGLIDAEINRRARVSRFSPAEVEQLYSLRVVNEALAISVSVPRFTDADLAELGRMLADLDAVDRADLPGWERLHQQFHLACLRYGGDRTVAWIQQWAEHTERYRRVYVTGGPHARAVGAAEHHAILAACANRDPAAAATLLARHLARAALTLIVMMSPEYDPWLIRAAVGQVGGTAPEAGPIGPEAGAGLEAGPAGPGAGPGGPAAGPGGLDAGAGGEVRFARRRAVVTAHPAS